MLKLNYIIEKDLPDIQLDYLKENVQCSTQHGVKFIDMNEENIKLQDFLPEECIFISKKNSWMQQAANMGMATLCYLPSASEEEMEFESREEILVDMYAEGMEEIDIPFLQRVYERHHGIPWKILETSRCIVREFSMGDLDSLFELYKAPGMTEYMEPLFSYEEEKKYQLAYIKHMYGFYGYGMWLVCDKRTGTLIGRAGIEHREELGGELELGYAIGVPYQRHGYATEVCRAIIDYVREELEYSDICCLIEKGNVVSRHLAEKLGFLLMETVEIGGKPMDKFRLHINLSRSSDSRCILLGNKI